MKGGLADTAGDLFADRPLASHADDIDDRAAAALAHTPKDNPGEVDEAEDFQIPRLPPGLAVDFGKRPARNGAGIVDQDIDVGAGSTELLDLLGDREVVWIRVRFDLVLGR